MGQKELIYVPFFVHLFVLRPYICSFDLGIDGRVDFVIVAHTKSFY